MDLDKQINVVKEILDKTDEELRKMKPASILVAGKTGVGKSTLINHLFRERLAETGIGKPVTEHVRRISKEGVPLVLYDTRGFELNPETQKTIKKEIQALFSEKSNTEESIDLVYYCIHSHSARIEQNEIEFIEELSKQLPVLIVLTQSFGEPSKEFRRYIENLNLHVAGVHDVLAKSYPISNDYVLPAYGLEDLVSRTFELIPEEKKESFNNAQQGDISRKAKAARRWATRYIATSFGVGFAPIPFSDASLLVPMQVTLLAHITAIFGISIDKSTLVSLIAGVGGTSGATFLGRSLVTNALKFIPGAGTLIGGVISGTTAAVVTSALAMSYIEVLTVLATGEKDGRYPDLNLIQKLMKEKFQEKLQKNKKYIERETSPKDTPNRKEKPKLINVQGENKFSKWMKNLLRRNHQKD